MKSIKETAFRKFEKNKITSLYDFKGGGTETGSGNRCFKDGSCMTYTSDYDHGGGNINYTGVNWC